MPSSFSGIEISRRALMFHRQALEVVGHNISNAHDRNYARQRVESKTAHPLYDPSLSRVNTPGMLPQGVEISSIRQIRDAFLDDRIFEESIEKGYWKSLESYLHRIEMIFNEPSEEGIRSLLDRFWQAWQELSQFPEEFAHREVLIERAKALVFGIRSTYEKLFSLRREVEEVIQQRVREMNEIARELAELNLRILKSEAAGDSPNDLYDRRNALIEKLSQIAPAKVVREKDEWFLYLGGEIYVQGGKFIPLVLKGDPKNEGFSQILWQDTQKEAYIEGGELKALLSLRDEILKNAIEKVDELALNIADIVNEIHKDGFSLTKETNIEFFHLPPLSRDVDGNVDSNGDGIPDMTAIFRVTGRNIVDPKRRLGISGVLTFYANDKENTPVYIRYEAEDTLEDVIRRINRSSAGVVAYVNYRGEFALKARRSLEEGPYYNFIIRHIEDSGELLVSYTGILQNSGTGGAFDYRRIGDIQKFQTYRENITFTPRIHPAGFFSLNEAIEKNPALISAASGKDVTGEGDPNLSEGLKNGHQALYIAEALKTKSYMVSTHPNPDEYYNALVSEIGSLRASARDSYEHQEEILTHLENLRQSVMGVNLDEEVTYMIQFQHGFRAAARVLQAINEMLEILINRLG